MLFQSRWRCPVAALRTDDRALHGVQRPDIYARKIGITGNVNEVELLAVDFDRRHGRADGDMTLDLFGIVITDRVSILDTTLAVSHAGGIEHRLNQRVLPSEPCPNTAMLRMSFTM